MSQSSGDSYENGRKSRDSYDDTHDKTFNESYDNAFDEDGDFRSYRHRSLSHQETSAASRDDKPSGGWERSFLDARENIEQKASVDSLPSSGSESSSPQSSAYDEEEDMNTTDQRYEQILDLLGRLEGRLRRNENDREETERDVEDLRRSLESLEDKYLQTDKNFYDIEGRVSKIDDLEDKVRNINAADQLEIASQIGEVRELIRDLGDKADDSERAYIKVEQKINSLQRSEDDWRESEAELKKRQVALEKSIHESQEELEKNVRNQQSDFEDILQKRQIETEQRLNERQSEISDTQTSQDKRLAQIENDNDGLKKRLESTQTEQIRMIEKLDDVLAQQSRLNRRLDKVDQDKSRILRKIEYLSELVDRNNHALQAKAMVLLTDKGAAERSNRPYVHPALSSREMLKRESFNEDDLHEENDYEDEDDAETPVETRTEERRILTSRDDDQNKKVDIKADVRAGNNEKDDARTQQTSKAAEISDVKKSGPFAERLTDFGQSDFENPDKGESAEKSGAAENKQSQDRYPRLDPADLEVSNDESFWEKASNSKATVASIILVFGLLAGWGFSVISGSPGHNQELAQIQAALETERASGQNAPDASGGRMDAQQAGVAGLEAAGNGQSRDYLPGKRFDFNRQQSPAQTGQSGTETGTGTVPAQQPQANDTSAIASKDVSGESPSNELRADEFALQPRQDQPGASGESDFAQKISRDNDTARDTEIARKSQELNRIEPTAGMTTSASEIGVIPPQKPSTHENVPSPEEAALRDAPVSDDALPDAGTGTVLSKPFFDPMTDETLLEELQQKNAAITTFIESQEHGNLKDRIRPDNTLSPIVQKIEEKAFQGIPEAQHDLAAIYTAGHAGTDQNFERAAFWFREAAVDGISNARYNLGVLHHQGLGVKADLKEAIRWYRAASMLGHPEAQYNLGIAHIEGIGTNYRPKLATYYFMKAAMQDVPEAAYNLGLIYENGLVGSEYPEVALYWYQLAANNGSKEASNAHDQLQDKLKLNEKDARKIFTDLQERFDGNERQNDDSRADISTGQRIQPQLASFTPSGSSDDSLVGSIQNHLIDVGLLPGPADGAFGPQTEDAIRIYQQQNDLKVTGLPSRELLEHLESR